MKVTAILPGNKSQGLRAINIYRITGPYDIINQKTRHTCNYLHQDTIQDLSAAQLDDILDSDIIVLQRLIDENSGRGAMFANTLKSQGAKLVYEADDDLTGRHRDISEGHNATCLPLLAHADAVTASTQPLADLMGGMIDKPAYVLPNYLPLQWFQHVAFNQNDSEGNRIGERTRKYPGTLNVMFVGTDTHREDWKIPTQAALDVLDEHENVRLIYAGYKPEYVPQHDQIIEMDPVPYTHYPITLYEADVVLAAVEPDDHFNKAKSAVKVLESWAAKRRLGKSMGGAAVIASKTRAYRSVVDDEINGLLVDHTYDAWREAIDRLITNDVLRQKLQRRGRHDVRKYNAVNHYREWVSAYTRILRS